MGVDFSVIVTCDNCGAEFPDDAGREIVDGGFDALGLNDEIVEAAGWQCEPGDVLCPDCKEE